LNDGILENNYHYDDHMTGVIRGLLRSSCNTMLGFAHDNTEVLERGAEYI
jgi:hypothetical protein